MVSLSALATDCSLPRQGFEDLHWPFSPIFGNRSSFRVLWWLYEGPSHVETKSVTLGCGRYHGGIYKPRFGKYPLHISEGYRSTWAWSRCMCIQDICLEAGWSSQNTFARFYKLDVQSLASQILSVSNWFMLLPFLWEVLLVQYITQPSMRLLLLSALSSVPRTWSCYRMLFNKVNTV